MKFEMTKDMRLNLLVGLMFFLVAIVAAYAAIDIIRSSSTRKKQDELLDIEIDTKKRVNKAVREGKLAMLLGVGANDGIGTEIPVLNNTPPADTEPEPDEKRLTIREWEKELGFEVLDPDGFDRTDEHLYERRFTKTEFLQNSYNSTVGSVMRSREVCEEANLRPCYFSDEPGLTYVEKNADKCKNCEYRQNCYLSEIQSPISQLGLDVSNMHSLGAGIVTSIAESDHIPHEEKMIEEVAATEEVDDGVIRAPFDGEIIEMRTGCFTIKAADKGMKITFDFDFCQVALHEVVNKGQILGKKA